MSKPIEGCPIEEKPIRERAWTAEQHDNKLIAALQSARDRMMRAITLKFGDAFDGDFDVMLDAINHLKRQKTATLRQQAALAQNAQGEIGVGVDVTDEGTHVCVRQGKTIVYSRMHHAERARVPATDADIAAWAERHDLSFGGSKIDARSAFEDAETLHLAAAQDQPEDAGHDE